MYIAMSMSMTYIQLIQLCTLAIWGGELLLTFTSRWCVYTFMSRTSSGLLFSGFVSCIITLNAHCLPAATMTNSLWWLKLLFLKLILAPNYLPTGDRQASLLLKILSDEAVTIYTGKWFQLSHALKMKTYQHLSLTYFYIASIKTSSYYLLQKKRKAYPYEHDQYYVTNMLKTCIMS